MTLSRRLLKLEARAAESDARLARILAAVEDIKAGRRPPPSGWRAERLRQLIDELRERARRAGHDVA